MDETYNLEAIVLNRYAFRESDSRVILYSREYGKLELVARGTKKIKSKIAPHIEPFNFVEVMAVKGKNFDYLGSAISRSAFYNIKNDLDLLQTAGQGLKIFNKLIKSGLADNSIFDLLKSYLEILNSQKNLEILNSLFIFKLLINLGHKPELYNCVNCGRKILPREIIFDFSRGGLICRQCYTKKGLTINENSVKLLRLAEKNNLYKLIKIKINKKAQGEIVKIVNNFLVYY